ADLTQSRVTLRDTGTKAQIPTTLAPVGDQPAGCLAHRHCHVDRTRGRVWDRHRIVEENHDAVARELVERPLELAHERSQRSVVFAQEVEHLLGLGGLAEGGVAAQIAEPDDDLAAVAFQDLLVALRDDEFGELRREEALQPPDPTQFLDLLDHSCLETAVQFRHLACALAQLAEQPRILHSDDRLRGETLKQRDLLVRERSWLFSKGGNKTQKSLFLAQRHGQCSPQPCRLEQLSQYGALRQRLRVRQIWYFDKPFPDHTPP